MPARVVRSYKFWRPRWLFRLNRFSEAAIPRAAGIGFFAHRSSRNSSAIGRAACRPVTRDYHYFLINGYGGILRLLTEFWWTPLSMQFDKLEHRGGDAA